MPKAITALFSVMLVGVLLLDPHRSMVALKSLGALSMQIGGKFFQGLLLLSFLAALVFSFTPMAKQKLSGSKVPEFSYLSWIALIICTLLAGGGLFWSAAEPIFHYIDLSKSMDREKAIIDGLALSHFHWGFTAWSILASLGVVSLRQAQEAGLSLRPRSLLYPFVPIKLIRGRTGDLVDGFCFLAVVAGTVGPIGFLGLQQAQLLRDLYGFESFRFLEVGLVLLLTLLYSATAVSGVMRGMKWLSVFNLSLALFLGLIVFVTHSPISLLTHHIYAQLSLFENFARWSLGARDTQWMTTWTWFYWAWFLGYAPMMSIIVTRVSRGRTIRQVILSVSLICPLVTNFWFSVIGGSLLTLPNLDTEVVQKVGAEGLVAALGVLVASTPPSQVLAALFSVLIFTFLATTGDSVSYSLSLASTESEEPPKSERLFWCLIQSALAVALLLGGGADSIGAFQSLILVTSVPVGLLMCLPLLATVKMILRGARSN